MTLWRLLLAASLTLGGTACTDETYIIGALCAPGVTCPAGGVGAGASSGSAGTSMAGGSSGMGGGLGGSGATAPGNLALDLTGSGVDRLPELLLGQEPSHFLVASDASGAQWPARVGAGFDVLAPAALALAQPAPFADPGSVLSHAAAVTFTSDSSWADTGAGALALELVFRAEPAAVLLAQSDATTGLELALDTEGNLSLRIDAGADLITVSSPALVADAWHHCLALLDVEQGVAQMFCNGQPGDAANVPAGFAVAPVAAAATLGSAGAARVHWAALGRWLAPSWGPHGAWRDVARERFARLVGTYAEGSSEPLPFAEVRASGAYIDMSPNDVPTLRRLHPVGEHWPRIVCRPTDDSPRTCGLLIEASSSRIVAAEAFALDQWDTVQTTVNAGAAAGPTGASTLFAVTPSAQSAEHALQIDAPFGPGPAVLSFFARAGDARRVRAEVVGVASATFDLEDPSVLESDGLLVASAEAWGDGLMRASFSFEVEAGPGQVRLSILADDSKPVFAGSGAVAAHLGDVELRFRSVSIPLPTFGNIQQADLLVYPAGNGNLPEGNWFSFSAEVWLPDAPLVADAAIFNANFATRSDQEINLFVRPADGTLQFWGLQGDQTHWQFSNPRSLTDGLVHEIVARVGPGGATLGVDDEAVTEPAGQYDLSALDRVEIGATAARSGPLTGLVRRVRIAPATP